MRKIEQAMVRAIRAGKDWASGNTTVHTCVAPERIATEIRLHGNLIARLIQIDRAAGFRWHLQVSLAGWNTATTRSRLTALAREFKPGCAGIGTCKGVPEIRYSTKGDGPLDCIPMASTGFFTL